MGVVFEVMGRGRGKPSQQQHKLTTSWSLTELRDVRLVARDVGDLRLPRGARVLASGVVDASAFGDAQVQQVPSVRAEFALDGSGERALLFLGGARQGSLALLTVDPELVSRLENEWRTLRDRAEDYVERLRVADLPGRTGVVVETRGLVRDVLPFKDQFLIRLEDEGSTIGVRVPRDPSDLRDEKIQVRGRLQKDSAGYPVIVADDIRRIR